MAVRDGAGTVVEWLGAAKDVSGRREAEFALWHSGRLGDVAVSGGRLWTWRWHVRERPIWGDAAFFTAWDALPAQTPYRLTVLTRRLDPAGQAEVEAAAPRARRRGRHRDDRRGEEGRGTAGALAGPGRRGPAVDRRRGELLHRRLIRGSAGRAEARRRVAGRADGTGVPGRRAVSGASAHRWPVHAGG